MLVQRRDQVAGKVMALRVTVKKVDPAVTRLGELQSTLNSKDSSQRASRTSKAATVQRLKIDQKVEVLEEIRERKREAREGWKWSQAGAASGSKGALRDGSSGKENAGPGMSAVKKRRKRPVQCSVNAPVAAEVRRGQALSNRSSNVAVDFCGSGGGGNCSPSASSSRSDNESRRRRVQATASEVRLKERPPWCSYTGGTATARLHAGGSHIGGPPAGDSAWRKTSAAATFRRRSSAKTTLALPTTTTRRRRRKAEPALAAGSKPRTPSQPAVYSPLHLPFSRTFHVDVRSNPNRPWLLSSSSSSKAGVPSAPTRSIKSPLHESSPVVPFPNSAFTPQSATAVAAADRAKLSPFRNFQLKPLKLPARISPTQNSPAATIRPYLSPSKVLSPKQSPRQSVTTPQPAASIDDLLCSTAASAKFEKRPRRYSDKQNWLTRRFSLPSPAAASSTRGFSLLARRDEGSPAKPLPSLITRLPARRKAREPCALFLSKKQPSAAAMAQPNPVNGGISPALPLPLPLPPALSGSSFHKRSYSCPRQQLRCLDANSSLHAGGSDAIEQVNEITPGLSKGQPQQLQGHGKENLSRIGSCNSIAFGCEGGRRKVRCGAFSNRGTTSAWPFMKRSWSFSHQRGHDCTSNCTGAGPFLLKHMKSWVHNTKSPHVDIQRMDSLPTFRSP